MISLLPPLQVDKKLFKEDQKLKGAGQTVPMAAQSIKRERAKYRASREAYGDAGHAGHLAGFHAAEGYPEAGGQEGA